MWYIIYEGQPMGMEKRPQEWKLSRRTLKIAWCHNPEGYDLSVHHHRILTKKKWEFIFMPHLPTLSSPFSTSSSLNE
jgi:hypothetical protein